MSAIYNVKTENIEGDNLFWSLNDALDFIKDQIEMGFTCMIIAANDAPQPASATASDMPRVSRNEPCMVEPPAPDAAKALGRLPEPFDVFAFANVGSNSENPATLEYLDKITRPFAEQPTLFKEFLYEPR